MITITSSRFVRRSLLREVIRFALIATICTTVAGFAIQHIVEREFRSKGVSIAKSVAGASTDLMIDSDGAAIQSTINQYLGILGVSYVVVLDQDGTVVSHTFVPEIPQALTAHLALSYEDPEVIPIQNLDLNKAGLHLDISAPILEGVAGYVHVGMDKQVITDDTIRWTSRLLGAVLVIFFGSVLVSYWSSIRVSRPLLALTEYASRVARLDFSVPDLDVHTGDELETLSDGMKRMKGELQRVISELEQTLSDILAVENMDDGLVITGTNGVIQRFNPRFAEMVQRPDNQLLGKPFDTILESRLIKELITSKNNPEEGVAEEFLLPEDHVAKGVGKPIFGKNPDGGTNQTIVGYVICLRDITREKELDEMKTRFMGTVSHELRTPLTSVMGFAALIEKKLRTVVSPALKGGEKAASDAMLLVLTNLQIILDEGKRLTLIINDLLDVMKMESGEMEWEMNLLDLGDVVKHATRSTSALFAGSLLSLQVDIDPNLPSVVGDRNRLIQVVINFISNAHKFTEEGSVTCRAYVKGNMVLVGVTDTGRGLSQEDQKQVFQRFKQVGNQLTGKPAGSGLGLAICKEIIEHHEGQIFVESEEGKGSTFSFGLPIPHLEIPDLPLQDKRGEK